MCLTINKNQKEQIATEDITCYKVIIPRVPNTDNDYITPYMNTPVAIGEQYHSEIRIDCDNMIRVALHSFERLYDAAMENYSWDFMGNSQVVKCVIPKGSTYYKGVFQGSGGYASNCIRYVEKTNRDR